MRQLKQHLEHRLLRTVVSLSAGALALALAAPSQAQYESTRPTQGSSPARPDTGSAAGSPGAAARLSEEDRSLIEDLAEANLAEIETGQLALSKSQNAQVRAYAQKMIDEHQAAQEELRTMAQAKGMSLPQETDLAHKTVSAALRLLSGDTFDSQYINRVGVNDHERTIELLQKAQTEARDPELKAMAGRMLPVMQDHLAAARQISQGREQREQQEDRQQQGERQQQGGSGTSGMGTGSGSSTGSGTGGTGSTR